MVKKYVGVSGGKFGAHGCAVDLSEGFVPKRKDVVSKDKKLKSVSVAFLCNGRLLCLISTFILASIPSDCGMFGYRLFTSKVTNIVPVQSY